MGLICPLKKITGASNVPNLRFPEFTGEWKDTTLGVIADIIGGGTPDTKTAKYWNGDIQWFTPSEIKSNYVSQSERTITELGLSKSSAKLLPVGAILITTRATIGEVAIATEECSTNQGFQSLVVYDNVDNVFVANWIRQNKGELIRRAKGSTFAEISKSEIERIPIMLPPNPDEQTKISALLSLLDDRISTQSQIIKELEALMKELSDKTFSKELRFMTDEGNDFPDWVDKKLSELCDKTKSGGTPKSTVREYYNGNIPFLSISDMTQQGKYLFSTEKTISPEGLENSTSWIVPINSVLYSMYASVGFVSINKIELATSQAVLNLIVKPDLNTEYLYYFLCYYRKHIDKYISTGAQGNLNAETIRDFVISTPSLEEQTKIVSFLSAIDVKIETEKQILKNYIAQKKYLLANMFI